MEPQDYLELIQLRKAIKLIRNMPIQYATSSKEPKVELNLIDITMAIQVADGETDPDKWISEPCENITRESGLKFDHSPHHWSEYDDSHNPEVLRTIHWCNGGLT